MAQKRKRSKSTKKSSKRRKTSPRIRSLHQYSSGLQSLPNLKRVDKAATAFFIDNTTDNSNVELCNGVSLGDLYSQRSGNYIQMSSLMLRMSIQCAPQVSGQSLGTLLRFALIYDKAPNGILPPISDMFLNSSSGSSGPYDPLNFNNRGRFKKLWEYSVATPAFTATVAGSAVTWTDNKSPETLTGLEETITKFIDFDWALDTVFGGSGASISSLNTGAIYFIAQSGFSAAATPWYVTFTTSIVYSDSKN